MPQFMRQSEYFSLVMLMMLKHYHIGLKVKTVNVGFLFLVPCLYVLKDKNAMIGDFFYHLHKKLPMIDSFPGIKKISCTYGYCLRVIL